MSSRAAVPPSLAARGGAKVDARTAEHSRDSEQVTARAGWRRWLEPREDWTSPHAMIPPRMCCRILDVYSWVAGVFGAVSGGVLLVQQPANSVRDPLFWAFIAMAGLQVAVASLRGLPFTTRYAALAVSLLADLIIGTVSMGLGPNLFFFLLMLLSSAALFFGARVGVFSTVLVALIFAGAAWGWTTGVFPLGATAEEAAAFLDFTHPNVWLRVLLGTCVCMAGLFTIAAYVLRRLNEALAQSTAALQKLALEQEQRAQAVEALRASEERFSKVFHFSPDAMCVSDLETGRYLEVNEGFERLFGFTRDEMIGRTAEDIGHWANPHERERMYELLREHGSVRDFQAQGRRRNGELGTFLVSAEIVEIAGRKALVTAGHDITRLQQAQEAVRESEEKFSKAFRSGPAAMAITDLETGRYLDVNEGFERLFGYSRDEVIGRTSLELGIWRTPAERDAFVAQLQADGAVRDLEIQGQNRRQDPLIYVVNAECMTLGGQTQIVSAIHDITDRKRAEAERTFAIARERQARDEFTRRLIAAQEAERRRIAGELHDSLGQNLLLVKNRAQLALASGAIPPEQRWQFESIHDMAAQAIAEVRQISHDLRPYQLDQLGLTGAIEAMIDAATRSTGFPFMRKLDPIDDVFTGEAMTHFYRIVQESVSNILKHARATRAQVIVERDIHHVRLWIEDDGRGFTPGAPAGEGGGFGLKNIAERVRIIGGTLNLDSAPDRGTRLEVLIKVPDAPDSPDAAT
jgi:PAS domain S-box-containing protein